ncbi:GNAT family N-acetyltransferase [Clostridium sp.]|uniref:GNAT family N-acetyltransferase n=1 Tax=Clostridium sp. TaxID=1506 RepID=UPI003464B188
MNYSILFIFLMPILNVLRRKGIGSALIQVCCDFCKENSMEFLQVKTLDESNPDPSYAKTREFYKPMGFKPLECFTELWDESNPCLIMIMHIDK